MDHKIYSIGASLFIQSRYLVKGTFFPVANETSKHISEKEFKNAIDPKRNSYVELHIATIAVVEGENVKSFIYDGGMERKINGTVEKIFDNLLVATSEIVAVNWKTYATDSVQKGEI